MHKRKHKYRHRHIDLYTHVHIHIHMHMHISLNILVQYPPGACEHPMKGAEAGVSAENGLGRDASAAWLGLRKAFGYTYWGNIGIMEKNMETTITIRGYIETTIKNLLG